MTDIRTRTDALRRPRLLIRAARFGLSDYSRDRDLRRLIHAIPPTEQALPRLMVEEEHLEDTRRAGDAAYSVTRHIEVLIALMAELRLLPRATE
ncbi:MAG: DUF6477 family protein [Pseudomonadota bacterium]